MNSPYQPDEAMQPLNPAPTRYRRTLLLFLFAGYSIWTAAQQPTDEAVDALLTRSEAAVYRADHAAVMAITDTLLTLLDAAASVDSSAYLNTYTHRTFGHNFAGELAEAFEVATRALGYNDGSPEAMNVAVGLRMTRWQLIPYADTDLNMRQELFDIENMIEKSGMAFPYERERLQALLGYFHSGIGDYPAAAKYFRKGLKLVADNREEFAEQYALDDPFLRYHQLLHDVAEEAGDRTALLAERRALDSLFSTLTPNNIEQQYYSYTLLRSARYFIHRAAPPELDRAQQYLTRAYGVIDREGTPHYLNYARHLEAVIRRKQGDRDAARRLNGAAIDRAGVGDRDFFTLPRYYLEALYLADGTQAARAALDTLVTYFHAGTTPPDETYTNFVPGRDNRIASLLTEAATVIEEHPRLTVLAPQLRIMALQTYTQNYGRAALTNEARQVYEPPLVGLLNAAVRGEEVAWYGTDRLLEFIEDVEGRLAWREFESVRLDAAQQLPDSLVAQEAQLRAALAAAKLSRGNDSLVFELNDQLRRYEDLLAADYPAHARISTGFSVGKIRQQLPPRTLALRYWAYGDTLFRFDVSRDELSIRRLTTTGWGAPPGDPSDEGGRTRLADWGQLLLDGLDLTTYDRLLIVPDGPVAGVPFEAIPATTTSSLLLDDKVISYLPYLLFATLTRTEAPTGRLHAFSPHYDLLPPAGDLALRDGETQLIGAIAESQYIATLFDGVLHAGSAADKAAFLEHAPNARLLHLAMHANIDTEQPELSYFAFGAEDERLYVEELYGMRLKADLAVLSACNTGRGEMDEGRGLVSLHRAFTYAGVPATVASLWAVPDAATERIMRRFYERLDAGDDKAVALQRAKQHYLATTDEARFKAPFYWAGFVLYGDTAPISGGGGLPWWGYALGLVGLLMAGVALGRRMG